MRCSYPEDKYKTKIELASEIITELIELGLNIELVLADSFYGESSQFIQKLTGDVIDMLKAYALAIMIGYIRYNV